MSGTGIVTAIVEILVSGLTGIGQGIGTALSTMATSIFMQGTGNEQSLSVFGTLVIVFCAISLGLALTRWVLNFITSLGNRNR